MIKKWFVALVASLVLAGAVVLPVSAHTENCQDNLQVHVFDGWDDTGHGYIHGVRSWINVPTANTNDFAYCLNPGIIVNNSSTAWVAIVPNAGNPDQIIQVGVCKVDTHFDQCDDVPAGKIGYFVAAGGCNGVVPGTTHQKTWIIDPGQHKYWIEKGTGVSTDWWYAYIDSKLLAQWYAKDPSYSCWLDSNTVHGQILGERHDIGDSLGTPSVGHYLQMNEIGYKRSDNDEWRHWVLSQGQGCNVQSRSDDLCSTRNDVNGGWNNLDLSTNP